MSRLEQFENIQLISKTDKELAGQLLIGVLNDIKESDIKIEITNLHYLHRRTNDYNISYGQTDNTLAISLSEEWKDVMVYKEGRGPRYVYDRVYKLICVLKMPKHNIEKNIRKLDNLIKQIINEL